MQSTKSSERASEPPSYPWAMFIGTTIALLTITLPVLAVRYYSANDQLESFFPTSSAIRQLTVRE